MLRIRYPLPSPGQALRFLPTLPGVIPATAPLGVTIQPCTRYGFGELNRVVEGSSGCLLAQA